MSNPSIASKLMTLVKGVIGPKKPATTPPSPPEPATHTTEVAQEREVAEEAVTSKERAGAPTDDNAESGGATDSTASAEPLEVEDRSAVAEELAVAEADTQVANDEVFDQVRKESSLNAEDLAVPSYDELTLPSIRARLRKLTMEQVRELRTYEVANQGRQEFVRMYDNRIEKLRNEGQDQ